MDTVLGCLVTDSVGPGIYSEKLVKNAKEKFSFDAAIPFRSPFDALRIGLGLLGIEKGSRVAAAAIAPRFHLNAIIAAGYTPVLYDFDAETCTPQLADPNIKTSSALVLFEPFGIIPSKEALAEIGMPIIEDMTQALGASRGEGKAGSLGNFAIYGMEHGSLVTSGGGALLCASSRRDGTALRNVYDKLPKELLLTDYNAALAVAQLRDYEHSVAKRKALENAFRAELARTRHRCFMQADEGETGLFAFPVLTESSSAETIAHAKKAGVESALAFADSIIVKAATQDGGEDRYGTASCAGARALALRCVVFPLHEKVDNAAASAIRKALATLP